MKKLLSCLLIAVISIITVNAAPKNKEIQKSVSAPFTRGVNFSSWLEFKNADQLNPYYYTKMDFENVKAMGCDVVRLPIHFQQLSSGAPNYTVAPEVFSILDDVAKWAEELKLYVIFDFHNNTAGGTSTPRNIDVILNTIWAQVSKRYANAGKYIVYEVYNEPHGIDKVKWGKIEANVIAEIRKSDKNHYIIAGGADWNSFDAMKSLPDFNDDKIMYTFHFYDPFLFTHQGANWTDLGRITGVPFPYNKEKMPPLPKNATNQERWYLTGDYNYAQKGTEKAVGEFFDQYVEFSLSRNAPIYCGEFGVLNTYADHDERVNWYKIVTDLLDERGIAHTSWDYYDSFGVFKKNSGGLFPQDLDRGVVEAMKLKVPEGKQKSWSEKAFDENDFTLFNEGFAKSTRTYAWDFTPKLINPESKEKIINVTNMKGYGSLHIDFMENVDFTSLVFDNYNLVLEIKNDSASPFNLQIWLQNSGVNTEYEWRMNRNLSSREIPNDGQYHKIEIPLKSMSDVGAWDNQNSTWINGKKKFNWADVKEFVISNQDSAYSGSIKIKYIGFEN